MRILLLIIVSFFISRLFAQTVPPNGYELVFIDEFEDDQVDENHWWKAQECWMHDPLGNGKNAETCCEKNFYKTENVIEEDGKLKLIAKREVAPCPDSSAHRFCQGISHTICDGDPLQYSSGWVHSGNAEWLYGYYEISCKVPEGEGFWPAFWFHGRNPDAYREIDVFEFCGINPDVFQYTLHQDINQNGEPDNNYRQNQYDQESPDADSKFFKYGLLWEEDFVQLFFDGKPQKKFANRILHEPMHLILNLAVNGCFKVNKKDGNCYASCDTPKEGIFEIDYVKVWQKKEKPQFEIQGLNELCLGEIGEFQIVSTQGATYEWNGSSGLNPKGDFIIGVPGGISAFGKFEAVETGAQTIQLKIEYNSGFSEIIEKEILIVEESPESPNQVNFEYEEESCIYSFATNQVDLASSYLWNINDVIYESEISKSRLFFHVPNNNITQNLEVIAQNGCGDSDPFSKSFKLPETSNCERGKSKLIIEPNPILNSGSISIQFENMVGMTPHDIGNATLKILNLQGKVVYETTISENDILIDTSLFPAGIYYAFVTSELFEATGVFVKD